VLRERTLSGVDQKEKKVKEKNEGKEEKHSNLRRKQRGIWRSILATFLRIGKRMEKRALRRGKRSTFILPVKLQKTLISLEKY